MLGRERRVLLLTKTNPIILVLRFFNDVSRQSPATDRQANRHTVLSHRVGTERRGYFVGQFQQEKIIFAAKKNRYIPNSQILHTFLYMNIVSCMSV